MNDERSPGSIKVIGFNLLGWTREFDDREKRSGIIGDMILDQKPDSFGLQECNIHWIYLLGPRWDKEYAWIGERNEDLQRNYNPVFYRRDKYRLIDTKTFFLSDTPDVWCSNVSQRGDQSRMVTYATLQNKQTGEVYTHFNTHLGIDRAAMRKQITVLKQITDACKTPFVLTGDFNIDDDWPEYNDFVCKFWKDARFEAPETTDDRTTFFKTMDYCVLSEGIIAEKFSVINDPYVMIQPWKAGDTKGQEYYLSDHYPVSTTFRLRENAPQKKGE